MRPRLRLLSDEMIGRILEEAFHLLETKGINLHHDGLLGRLAELGCRTDTAKKWVWVPRDLVGRCIRSAPRRVKLWNIVGTKCCDLSGDSVDFTPGSAAIR
jgi:trimethylamine:corrinoid methyltransferase-like protein